MKLLDWIKINLIKPNGMLNAARFKPWKTGRKSWIEIHHKNRFDEIILLPGESIHEKIFMNLNGIDLRPMCKNLLCSSGKSVGFKGFQLGYYDFCSYECCNSDINLNNKRVKTKKTSGGYEKATINAKQTCLKKYGVDNPFKYNPFKERGISTSLSRYGVKNPAQSVLIQNKMKATCLERYGVNHPLQDITILEKALKNGAGRSKTYQYHDTDIWYQGENERKFLDSVDDISLVQRGPMISYRFDNSDRRYFSDFIIGNTIYEIKSNWTWSKKGKDKKLRVRNKLKLRAAKRSGFNIVLVYNGKKFSYNELLKLK